MSFQVNQPRQTGSLPSVFQPAGTQPAPEALFNPANPFAVPAAATENQTESVAQIASSQGESLPVMNLFVAPFSESADSAESGVAMGLMIFDDLARRRGQGSEGGARQPLDYSLARMTESPSPLEINQLDQTLQELNQRLQGLGVKDAGPLTADELARFNGTLKTFGLKTDGINIYNLSVRASDPVTNQRRPIQVSRSQIDTLRSACAAVRDQFEKNQNPFMGAKLRSIDPSESEMSPIAVRFGVPEKPNQLTDSGAIRLRETLMRRSEYDAMISESLSYIDESAALVQELTPKLEQTNKDLTVALKELGNAQTHLVTEKQNLLTLKQTSEHLLGQASIQVSPADLPALNRQLAGAKLEIRLEANGQPQFLQSGKTLTEADFRRALLSSVEAQATTVQQLDADLGRQSQQVEILTARSTALTEQIQSRLPGADTLLAKNEAKLRQVLGALQALRANPEEWLKLSAEDQQKTLEMIESLNRGLQQFEKKESQHEPVFQRGREVVNEAHQGQQKAEGLLKQAQKQRQQIAALLAAVNQGLERLADKAESSSVQATPAEPLLNQADELEATLNLAPQPDGAALRKLSEDWLNELQSNFREFSQLHRTESSERQNQLESFDRSIRVLREQLNYHEQQLDSLADRSHDQVRQALLDSVSAFKGLAKP